MGRIAIIGLISLLSATVLVSFLCGFSFENHNVTSLLGFSHQDTEMLASFRSDLPHPYDSMHAVDDKFINPYNMRQPALNPAPLHPYNNGKRPKAVLHREFEHNPYGNKFPWETDFPSGALAKDIKRPDRYLKMQFVLRYTVHVKIRMVSGFKNTGTL